MAEPRARHDDRAQIRITDVDGDTGGQQLRFTGCQFDAVLGHRAQVDAGRRRRGVIGQRKRAADARVENAQFDGPAHALASARRSAIRRSNCCATAVLLSGPRVCVPSAQNTCKVLQSASKSAPAQPTWLAAIRRSEEQTSELQSLMRISYAVFCLKTNKKYATSKQHKK